MVHKSYLNFHMLVILVNIDIFSTITSFDFPLGYIFCWKYEVKDTMRILFCEEQLSRKVKTST